jgi:hypothetical protein
MLVLAGARRVVRRLRRMPDPGFVVIEHEHPHVHPHGHDHRSDRRRDAEATAGAAAAAPRVATVRTHAHRHRHVLPVPDDPFLQPTVPAAFGIGMLHGVGAETPTQVLVLVGAAGVASRTAGVALLVCFVVGLLVSNATIAAIAACGYLTSARHSAVYVAVSVATAVFSAAVGTLFLIGSATTLPSILGG